MYRVVSTNPFRKDYKRLCKSGRFDVSVLNKVINTLAAGQLLEWKYKDHSLKGSMEGFRECHIKPDLLLVYSVEEGRLILQLVRMGSHSEIY